MINYTVKTTGGDFVANYDEIDLARSANTFIKIVKLPYPWGTDIATYTEPFAFQQPLADAEFCIICKRERDYWENIEDTSHVIHYNNVDGLTLDQIDNKSDITQAQAVEFLQLHSEDIQDSWGGKEIAFFHASTEHYCGSDNGMGGIDFEISASDSYNGYPVIFTLEA